MNIGYYDPESEAKASAAVAKEAKFVASDEAQANCSNMIEPALRNQSLASYPEVCDSITSMMLGST